MCLCGNHDVGNRPTRETIQQYKNTFGDDYFAFWAGGVRFICLNSSLWSNSSLAPDAQHEQEQWLEQEFSQLSLMQTHTTSSVGKFKRVKKRKRDHQTAINRRATHGNALDLYDSCQSPVHTIVFQHHPWFLHRPDEQDMFFMSDCPGEQVSAMNFPLSIRRPALNMLKQHGVRAVFAGHLHRNSHGWDEGLEMITTSAVGMQLGPDKSGLRIVKVWQDDIEHCYFDVDNLPSTRMLQSIAKGSLKNAEERRIRSTARNSRISNGWVFDNLVLTKDKVVAMGVNSLIPEKDNYKSQKSIWSKVQD